MHKSARWILPLVILSMIAAAWIGVSLRQPHEIPYCPPDPTDCD